MTMNVLGYATHSPTDALVPYRFERREPRADDVVVEILYCGVCHTDLHRTYALTGGWNCGLMCSKLGVNVWMNAAMISLNNSRFKR